MKKRLFKILFSLILIGTLFGIVTIVGLYLYVKPSLPDVQSLREVKLQQPMRVLTRDGKLITQFGEKRRIPISYDEVPTQMVHAFVASEDDRFFAHPGVDYRGILRAVWVLTTTGEKRVGGSTITMQVAREFYLSRKKDYMRKIREIFLALKIEQEMSKDEILTLFMNKTFLGQRAYGVAAAARVYYGKTPQELSLDEIATIAGIPQAPSRLNPVSNPEAAKNRRAYVLRRMLEQDYISQAEHDEANLAPIETYVHSAEIEVEAPYIAEMVRNQALELYGDAIYSDGYQIVTTLNSSLQNQANQVLRKALHEYDERHGFRRLAGQLNLPTDIESMQSNDWRKLLEDFPDIGMLKGMLVLSIEDNVAELVDINGERHQLTQAAIEWAKPKINRDRVGEEPKALSELMNPGAVIYVRDYLNDKGENELRLAQSPEPEGALIALDPKDGAIISLVGGYDFVKSKFNRVTQAQRQPGSSFKPFVYSAALEHGFNPASIFNDAPVVFEDDELESTWRPQNSSQKFYGPTRMREALTKSRNLVSIRILREMGIQPTVDYLTRFGFPAENISKDLSLALGSAAMSPLQMAQAYAIFANGGFKVEPYFIDHIEDSKGERVYEAAAKVACPKCPVNLQTLDTEDGSKLVFVPENLEDDQNDVTVEDTESAYAPRVVDPRNVYIIQSMMRDVVRRGTATKAQALKRSDLAGKTGTTNDQRDAWFAGFVPSLVTISWVGFDDMQKLGNREFGAIAALPMWIDFMRVALEDIPVSSFDDLPNGMVQVEINPETGLRLTDENADGMEEIFFADNVPDIQEESIADIFFFEGEETIVVDEEGEETVELEEESLF
ncbi:MAG: penicillin-binding protein 1A [Gammaproteobacteria bacterium]|nr:penicillin-binding protein 1A [Gammaproteobacteria bacterium]NNC97938.1 penicillin-binding protein 1A [Gammaproteobacteria bacterium]NNM14264.1 penicillin-binding protein 1A [Gammaproteobacteria bacterium]